MTHSLELFLPAQLAKARMSSPSRAALFATNCRTVSDRKPYVMPAMILSQHAGCGVHLASVQRIAARPLQVSRRIIQLAEGPIQPWGVPIL